jgi:two-component system, LuxR family, response regulator FixJ
MSAQTPTVCIVDFDPQVVESVALMVRSAGLNAESYGSAEAFLDGHCESAYSPGCLVLGFRLPGLSGLGLLRMLAAVGKHIPAIMISGDADVPMAVEAIRCGALDFLVKPINNAMLLSRIREAIDHDIQQQRETNHKTVLIRQISHLSTRQREVFDLLISGENTKQIAKTLDISDKTVAKHRAAILEKMQVDSVVDLVRLSTDARSTYGAGHAFAAPCHAVAFAELPTVVQA